MKKQQLEDRNKTPYISDNSIEIKNETESGDAEAGEEGVAVAVAVIT